MIATAPGKIHRGIKQGTYEWGMIRLGKATASEFDKLITPKTMKPSAQAEGYIRDLIAERIRGCVPDDIETFTSRAMQHGTDTEPIARSTYQAIHDVEVDQVTFIEGADPFFGCSPDSLVGDDGGLELKCPKLETHIGYMLDPDSLVMDYRHQVHGCLLVTGRSWWDIASFAPWGGVPMVVVRVYPDEFTEKLGECLLAFKAKYDEAWAQIEPRLSKTHPLGVPRDEDHPF